MLSPTTSNRKGWKSLTIRKLRGKLSNRRRRKTKPRRKTRKVVLILHSLSPSYMRLNLRKRRKSRKRKGKNRNKYKLNPKNPRQQRIQTANIQVHSLKPKDLNQNFKNNQIKRLRRINRLKIKCFIVTIILMNKPWSMMSQSLIRRKNNLRIKVVICSKMKRLRLKNRIWRLLLQDSR